MRAKKLLAAGICITMAASLFAGCDGGGKQNDVGEMTKEEIEKFEADAGGLKLPLDKKGTQINFMTESSNTGMTDSTVIKELSRRTGAKIVVTEIPLATMQEKAKVLVASKAEMPDVITGGFNAEELNDLGMQGAFEPVLEHLDELPNFKNLFIDKAEELRTEKVMKSWKASDGNLYMFPSYGINRDVNHGMMYRKDIFDKHGIQMWDSPESYYQVLKKLKELYPTSTPMVSKTGTNFFNQLAASWGIQNWPGMFYDHEAKTWKYSSMDPRFKEFLDYIKKLYDEKLLDPEFLTCTQAAWTTKMTLPNQAFTTFDWIDRMDMFYEQAKNTVPDYNLRYGNPVGPLQKVITISSVGNSIAFKKSDKSELAMKVNDYLLSDGGAELMTCGIEGVTFNWNEDKSHAVYIGFDMQNITIKDLEEKYGMCLSGTTRRYDRRSAYFNYTEKNQEAQDLMNNKAGGGYLPEDPQPTLTAEEKEIVTKNDPKLRKLGEEFASKYILSGESGDAAWNNFLNQMETNGASATIAAQNAAQARYDQQ